MNDGPQLAKVSETKPGEISVFTDIIEMEISRLENNFGMLYDRLSNIIPDESETTTEEEPDQPPARTILGRAQADQARRLHGLNRMLERLRNKVEN